MTTHYRLLRPTPSNPQLLYIVAGLILLLWFVVGSITTLVYVTESRHVPAEVQEIQQELQQLKAENSQLAATKQQETFQSTQFFDTVRALLAAYQPSPALTLSDQQIVATRLAPYALRKHAQLQVAIQGLSFSLFPLSGCAAYKTALLGERMPLLCTDDMGLEPRCEGTGFEKACASIDSFSQMIVLISPPSLNDDDSVAMSGCLAAETAGFGCTTGNFGSGDYCTGYAYECYCLIFYDSYYLDSEACRNNPFNGPVTGGCQTILNQFDTYPYIADEVQQAFC